jgi:endo-1,4-beta-D-glucanase Y
VVSRQKIGFLVKPFLALLAKQSSLLKVQVAWLAAKKQVFNDLGSVIINEARRVFTDRTETGFALLLQIDMNRKRIFFHISNNYIVQT